MTEEKSNNLKIKFKKYGTMAFYSLTFLWGVVSVCGLGAIFFKVIFYKLGIYSGLDKFGKPILINLDVYLLMQLFILLGAILIVFIILYSFKKIQAVFLLLFIQILFFSEFFIASYHHALGEITQHGGAIYKSPFLFTILSMITFWLSIILLLFAVLNKRYFKNKESILVKILLAIAMLASSFSVYYFFNY